jgi:hypothetical protein
MWSETFRNTIDQGASSFVLFRFRQKYDLSVNFSFGIKAHLYPQDARVNDLRPISAETTSNDTAAGSHGFSPTFDFFRRLVLTSIGRGLRLEIPLGWQNADNVRRLL